jgi:hypothetical protein
MIQHLIASDPSFAGDALSLVEIANVEVADPHERILPSRTSSSNAAMMSSSGYRPRQCNR